MSKQILILILVWVTWGCESMTTNHQTNKPIPSGPPFTLTSLSKSDLQGPMGSPEGTFPEMSDKGMGHEKDQQKNNQIDPFPTVYFNFDSWEISSDVQSRLDATANWMNRFPNYGLTIEGHTDIRGTESYNMILGVRRAKAVKEYLANLGIPRQRLDTVSYGKTLALCEVDDEHNCHQFNRRADLLLE